MAKPTLLDSGSRFAWGMFKRSYWLIGVAVLNPYGRLSWAISIVAPKYQVPWHITAPDFWIIVACIAFCAAVLTFHNQRVSDESRIDQLTPPPEHPRVAEAKAELRRLADEASKIAMCDQIPEVVYRPWRDKVDFRLEHIGGRGMVRCLRDLLWSTPSGQRDETMKFRHYLALGASWLRRAADDLEYEDLTPMYSNPSVRPEVTPTK